MSVARPLWPSKQTKPDHVVISHSSRKAAVSNRSPGTRTSGSVFSFLVHKRLPRHGPTTRSGCPAANPPLSPGLSTIRRALTRRPDRASFPRAHDVFAGLRSSMAKHLHFQMKRLFAARLRSLDSIHRGDNGGGQGVRFRKPQATKNANERAEAPAVCAFVKPHSRADPSRAGRDSRIAIMRTQASLLDRAGGSAPAAPRHRIASQRA
jgi:hypothetical protein